ncbi:altronate dehydratase family protein [Pseudomonas sp. 148P]|uniref:Altronate dehydratase family protein n=1 Tax=Pseudomonas ulcerans TaxID=3115852 RepID=A0ABU7HYS6_9PSED|nr:MULTISPECIES: altronate dehydratase family protein [unclassified Pseudomonas]MEE1926512.1 altronate dehydratase family protein [Pseudomonas sp. 147P]MEE1936695.1 altronate dehydratase family protein [Pseudomonas sp. 148P]
MNSREVSPVIRLDAADNVVIARIEIPAGTAIPGEGIATQQAVPLGHKIAARAIARGEAVLKYNTVIGYAAEDLAPGTWMHSHNIAFGDTERDYRHGLDYVPTELLPPAQRATFQGIVRDDGRVATRNYLGVFVVGNCGATVARKIANHFDASRLAAFPQIDGVVPFVHEIGCGMEMTGEPMDLLRRTIAGHIKHPNTVGALVIALGCERNNIHGFFEQEGLVEGPMLKKLVIQDVGGVKSATEQGIALIEGMLPKADEVRRQPVSAEHLMIGMQCGGSDGFSGLSANPALGAAVDILVRHGGTAILSETSEIFGVEHTLTARAVTPEVGRKLVARIDWWLEYNRGRDTQINGRVSPGNNAGGLANVLEKSLGGAKKGGNAPLMDVYEYAHPVTARGLVFMDTPGYDPVSATGQIAGGANLIAFTTGRGSCFGSVPAPTFKLASNSPMYQRMSDDMDINCGQIIDGDKTIAQMGQEIFERLLAHASGEQTKSELNGLGEDEFCPWQIGVLA